MPFATIRPPFLKTLFLIDAILTYIIIQKVRYTEIDYTTYKVQASQILAGELNYAKIKGPSGPIVYPALHARIFQWIEAVDLQIDQAQYLWMLFYFVNLIIAHQFFTTVIRPHSLNRKRTHLTSLDIDRAEYDQKIGYITYVSISPKESIQYTCYDYSMTQSQ